MKLANSFATLALCALAGLFPAVQAQDTDLFMSTLPDGPKPNVLIIWDNTSNWGSRYDDADGNRTTRFALEQAAMRAVVEAMPAEKFNLGLMMFTEPTTDVSGGYVRYAIRELNEDTRPGLLALIDSLDDRDDQASSATPYAKAMHEAYLYFYGLNAYAGHTEPKNDPLAFSASPRYNSPIEDNCVNNYVLFISNGAPSENENNDARDLLDGLKGKLPGDPITLNPNGRQSIWSDEYARFMSAKNIKTYTIEVGATTTGQGDDLTELLESMGTQGDGGYWSVDSIQEMIDAMDQAFSDMQDVNSVFAATALPVSVNVRGTYLNEVYMAVFRPDADAKPRWFGNLKLYQFVVNSAGDLVLADSQGNPALGNKGFIKENAISFWTEDSDYWTYRLTEDDPASAASDSPDGEVVEKGGTAQQQRIDWSTGRNLYTCSSGGCSSNSLLSGTAFSNANVTAANLGVADDTERDLLIDWIRGEDNYTVLERAADQVRPSLHGDVVHSRPAVINYNNDGEIVVFYGANDGVFRAVRGGKNASDGGSELWGFVPPEFFAKFNRLRTNEPAINVPSEPDDPDGNKPYFVDGAVSAYRLDANNDGRINSPGTDKAYVFVTMRRGGRFLYAFNVTNPEAPRFLWKRSNTSTDFGELGETWSEAKVAQIRWGAGSKTVLIMGAGYDPAANDSETAGTATMGRGVMVIDAETGDMLWQAGPTNGIQHSIPADVTLIDRNRDGYIDRVYAVDTGANIWRLDIGDSNSDNWLVNKLASLGGTGSNARKFLFPVDVVYSSDANGPFDAVLVGSGDREHPFEKTVTNHFYMIKDRRTNSTGVDGTIALSNLYNASNNLVQDDPTATDENELTAAENLLSHSGWYIELDEGEKVVGSAVAIAGTVFFSTNLPDPPTTACTDNLGEARIYSLNYKDASATIENDGEAGLSEADRYEVSPGGGFLPSPTPVVTEIDGEKEQTVCFGPNCVSPPNVELEKRKRVFWNKNID